MPTPPPGNTVAPAVSGLAAVGYTLSCDTGTWTDPAGNGLTYSYQWKKITSGGMGGATSLTGKTSPSLVLDSTHLGLTIRCDVSATDQTMGTGFSNQVGPVVASTPQVLIAKAQRGPHWSRGVDGILEDEKQFEDMAVCLFDWSDYLQGETIASAAFATDGIILSVSGYDSTRTIAQVTGIGSMHVDITTSGGRVFREYFRWRRLHRPVLGTMGGGQSMPGEDYHG